MIRSEKKVGIEAISYSLGKVEITNEQLQFQYPNWDMNKTLERTGVRLRPIATSSETALDLGYEAAIKVLEKLKIDPDQIDTLIFCTQTPDYLLPPNSTLLHGLLNMPVSVMAFDISHACSGFIYSLGIARSLVVSGGAKRVLVVTSDTYSRLIHPQDKSIIPLFGDGAAATVVSALSPIIEIIDMEFFTSGKHFSRFIIKNGGFRNPDFSQNYNVEIDKSGRVDSPNHIYMDGMGVLSFFNSAVPAAINMILKKNRKSIDQIDLFLFHQASRLVLDGLVRSLKIPSQKVVIDMATTGNLVSSSIPVLLEKMLSNGMVKRGQLVVLCGFGVGFSWGTALVQF
jgi:3-oxoacyl-[acyl-carrier-protein] synthase III